MEVTVLATLALAITLAAAPPAGTPPGPVTLTRSEADSVRRTIETSREETRTWLKSAPTSYLATILRAEFLFKSSLTVGRDSGEIKLPDLEPAHLRVTVVGDSFRVQALDPAATFKVKGRETRAATVGPSSIEAGRYTLRLSHQRYPAIIVFDPRSPRLKEYKGIEYFPVDLKWRYVLALTPNPRSDTTIIASTRGYQRRAVLAGWFDFMVGETRCRLEAHRLLEPGVGENDIAVFFRDATTGKETYQIGRYIDPVALPDGRYLLDFNYTYNPACAYSVHYNCPLPPRRNRLAVDVRAGEKDSHYLDHVPGP